jgi:hypothetical protein
MIYAKSLLAGTVVAILSLIATITVMVAATIVSARSEGGVVVLGSFLLGPGVLSVAVVFFAAGFAWGYRRLSRRQTTGGGSI